MFPNADVLHFKVSNQQADTTQTKKKSPYLNIQVRDLPLFFITIKCQHALEVKLDLVEGNTMYNGKYLFWYLVVKEDEANDS